MQIKTRVAGVLATSAAAIAIMGGPAFASNNQSSATSSVTATSRFSAATTCRSRCRSRSTSVGNAVGLLGFANASCQGGAGALLDSFNG